MLAPLSAKNIGVDVLIIEMAALATLVKLSEMLRINKKYLIFLKIMLKLSFYSFINKYKFKN